MAAAAEAGVRGPNRYVRYPMPLAINTMLAAEAYLFGSWYLAVWAVFYILLNTVYFASIEEPARAGEALRQELSPLQGQRATLDTEAEAVG